MPSLFTRPLISQRRYIFPAFLLGLFLVLLFHPSCVLAGQELSEIGIHSADGQVHVFKVEIAATPEKQAKGLMFRRDLALDGGMLFDFLRTEPVAMWMKNTFLPLDMFFITADGLIVMIAERTVPGSLAAISANVPVRFVLEVNGGTASRLRLKEGDRVIRGLPK
ncbi:MAG: DUF192 domain-containing protein [Alphaproteobacteria bacterium]|nr:DUF192 domain-containing protein [Alphaproteobacteria bacterium]